MHVLAYGISGVVILVLAAFALVAHLVGTDRLQVDGTWKTR